MKFLLIVLTLQLLVELLGRKRKARLTTIDNNTLTEIRHPAEHEVRENFEWRIEWW